MITACQIGGSGQMRHAYAYNGTHYKTPERNARQKKITRHEYTKTLPSWITRYFKYWDYSYKRQNNVKGIRVSQSHQRRGAYD